MSVQPWTPPSLLCRLIRIGAMELCADLGLRSLLDTNALALTPSPASRA